MVINEETYTVDQAQSLRLKRMVWGVGVQACTMLIVGALYGMGMVPGLPVMIYLGMIAALDLVFFALVKTGVNLRFEDPSMTARQITLSVFPVIYIMFHVVEPQARMVLLLMGTSSLLFGMFRLGRCGMLLMVGCILGGYLGLLVALSLWAPERVNLLLEAVVVFAYTCVLVINAYLGSVVASMRRRLKTQNRELAELATLDPLTRLPNRRSLMAQLTRESARTERRTDEQDALCVSMLDVDNFKEVNDTWGHEAGDRILCEIADALRGVVREGDFVGRFGGEEFVIILPETSLDDACAMATRIRDTVAARHFSGLPGGGQVTVSQGVADHRIGECIEDTLRRADDRLYQAKDGGRNLVAC
ncbi:diguanylate cyclase [Chromatocurvus halotolerans]|uniref:diguanylate cyclase n=1 Tax=Chromatocurvus halotolerans TaxID=1132028 RepID=A0A4R2KZ15_9GAMM|nr:diguanylate cyclase [Chromatocurvus halotolerans]TCO75528.1 diguanylate cyclase (GGDEF)-like protein [Chromatocurvus halotolerans]